jgi:hypothetical protein
MAKEDLTRAGAGSRDLSFLPRDSINSTHAIHGMADTKSPGIGNWLFIEFFKVH